MKVIEDKTLTRKLWDTLDKMRDHSPITETTALLAGFLFWRWADKYEEEQEAIAAFDDTAYFPALAPELRWHRLPDIAPGKISEWMKKNVFPILKPGGRSPLGHSLSRVASLFESHVNRIGGDLHYLIRFVDNLRFETPDDFQAAGELLDTLLRQLSSKFGHFAGQYLTPPIAAEIMVELANPQPGERIYDPCFGAGEILLACARRLKENAAHLPPHTWMETRRNTIFGGEINTAAYVIALTRLVLAGIETPGLELSNSLERPVTLDQSAEKFDCILADPPWGARVPQSPGFHFPIKSGDSLDLFIQHILLCLRPKGRAVVTVPNGFLFRTGTARKIRQKLLTQYQVEGIVALPSGTFSPYTMIESNLLVFRREEPSDRVRFLRVPKFSYVDNGADPADYTIKQEARKIAGKFRSGKLNSALWETTIKEIRSRDWDLHAKRSGDDLLEKFFRDIQEIAEDIPLETLDSIAHIYSGFSYEKNLTTSRKDEALHPLLRVADISDKIILEPNLFLNKKAKSRLKNREMNTKTGDILLTCSGTIGKTGLVKQAFSGAIPAKSIITIRPKQGLIPGYLLALLRSECYQKWLSGHSRGATIQHLSIRVLKNLVIPIPEIQVQERFSRLLENNGGDGASLLLRLLSGTGINPVIDWLESDAVVQEIKNIKHASLKKDRLVLLERFFNGLKAQRNNMVHGADKDLSPEIGNWLLSLNNATQNLTGMVEIPTGPTKYSLLEAARLGIKNAANELKHSTLPIAGTAARLSENLSQIIEAEIDAMLTDRDIEASVTPTHIPAGRDNEVIVSFKNPSHFPLRSVQVKAKPAFGKGKQDYLGEGNTFFVPLNIPARAAVGSLNFTVEWQARRIDGKDMRGEIPLAVKIQSTRDALKTLDPGTSPYNGQDPVQDKNMFFGRGEILDKIRYHLSKRQPANVILLEGNRRSGKTSILYRVWKDDILPGWLPVICNFQGGEGDSSGKGLPTHEVFRLMARDIGLALADVGNHTWFPGLPAPHHEKSFKPQFVIMSKKYFTPDQSVDAFELYLQDVLENIKPKKLLLLLDEFDKIQEGIEAGVTSPIVPENLRYLLYTYNDFSVILAGSRRLKRLREDVWSALFGLGERIPVGPLEKEDARLLVTQPVAGRLNYGDAARDGVVEWCACRPNLIQSLCDRIFQYAAVKNEHTITLRMVDQIVEYSMVQENEHLSTLWDYAGTERRRLILNLCARSEDRKTVTTFSVIDSTLEDYGIYIPRHEKLEADIEELKELELIEMDSTSGNTFYRVSIPLFEEWIRKNIDPDIQIKKAKREGEEKHK